MADSTPLANTDDLRQALGELVVTSYRVTRLAAQSTGSQEAAATWAALSVLNSYGPVRLGELASYSRVAQPTMTKIVRGLLDSGWVARATEETDARAVRIAITKEGEDALEQWRDELADALVPFFVDLPERDLAVLQRTVEILGTRVGGVHHNEE